MSPSEIVDDILSGRAVRRCFRADIWNGELTRPAVKKYSISICTTCMNRKDDLAQTLEKNILGNADYGDVQFVLLDYGSTDGLRSWVRQYLYDYIKSKVLVYYYVHGIKYYSMTHSRNVAFKLADGEIVNNVDADALTNDGFAFRINQLANERPEMAIFCKGKRMMRGRLGFYKKEFVELLRGYDEGLHGYGHDDHDLCNRALALGMRMMWFGGEFHGRIASKKHQIANFFEKDWRHTEAKNKMISFMNIAMGRLAANRKIEWGKAVVSRNFEKKTFVVE